MSEPGHPYRKPTVEELRRVFGEGTIFLPCRKKKATPKLWQKRTALDLNEAAIRAVDLAPQTGVLCGENSDGLVCLDLDTPDGLAAFTNALPPDLRTTRLVGKPGRAKFFFRVPKHHAGNKRDLKRNGVKAGDYIANASQAIVAGIHHETRQPYRIEDENPPFQTTLDQLNAWLEAAGFQRIHSTTKPAPACVVVCSGKEEKKNTSSISPESETNETHLEEIERRMAVELQTEQAIAALPEGIRELFQKHVRDRWHPEPGRRNRFIVEAVPVLIRRMSPARVHAVCMTWLQVYRAHFNDTEEQHAAETCAHIDATLATYRQSLKTRERGIYDHLPDRDRDAFRICRDLARCDGPPPPPQFYLAAGELARRIEGHVTAAARTLGKLERLGIISLSEQGAKHAPGKRGRANIWKWNLSLEAFEPRLLSESEQLHPATESASAVDTRNGKNPEESTPPET